MTPLTPLDDITSMLTTRKMSQDNILYYDFSCSPMLKLIDEEKGPTVDVEHQGGSVVLMGQCEYVKAPFPHPFLMLLSNVTVL